MKILLLGNAGAGKTTFAHHIMSDGPVPCLSLDEIAWAQGAERKPLPESLRELDRFLESHNRWIIEGCYDDLVEQRYFLRIGYSVGRLPATAFSGPDPHVGCPKPLALTVEAP
jgi:adenylate kinase family enzyme